MGDPVAVSVAVPEADGEAEGGGLPEPEGEAEAEAVASGLVVAPPVKANEAAKALSCFAECCA